MGKDTKIVSTRIQARVHKFFSNAGMGKDTIVRGVLELGQTHPKIPKKVGLDWVIR